MSDPIKEAFDKVKEDIYFIQEHLKYLQAEMLEIKRTIDYIKKQTHTQNIQTDRQITPTDQTHFKALKPSNLILSIGNDGVPTDRQTDTQTDRHIQKFAQNEEKSQLKTPEKDALSQIESVSQILDSLDSLKKDLRLKFKKLTSQEIHIFSLIYQLEEQGNSVDYSLLAEKTSLSQSSIRDYVLKLVKKGIPVDKKKENNKQVTLSIPQEFKKIASLDTILSLREL